MVSNEPKPKIDGVTTTTWIFTVDVSGNISGSCNAKTGDCVLVTNSSKTFFIGNIYALEESGGDQTKQLLGVDFMLVGTTYPIILSFPPDAPAVSYFLRTSKDEPIVLPDESANGTLRVGG
jgi:hypothetical protein